MHLAKFLRISCPLKMLLKYVNACYNALITINRQELQDIKASFNLRQSCVEFMYD